jgi:4-hydroxythreonine-4-phosphate dehydrogenase
MNPIQPSPVVLGITCGDPGGIGLECFLKALEENALHTQCALVLFVAPDHLRIHQSTLQSKGQRFTYENQWRAFQGRPDTPGLYLKPLKAPDAPLTLGRFHEKWGAVSRDALDQAISLALDGTLDGIITLPICKESLLGTAPPYPGQTEMCAQRSNTTRYAMMLAGPSLRVIPATIHIPLRDVAKHLNTADLTDKILLVAQSLKEEFHIADPVIAVCGLNPHAGESGRIGSEEIQIIAPAIKKARDLGVNAKGPYPADGLFVPGRYEEMDAIISMYHDQGLIPLKLLHFDEAVNTTLGIPFVRTSPDHGVGYDIAGQDQAHEGSTLAALQFALKQCTNRQSIAPLE